MIDYYKLFGLDKDCDSREVKEKYNEKMLSINNSDILEYTFKTKYYREGLEVLTNYAVRARYDEALEYQYAVTALGNNSNLRFSDMDLLNERIIKKVDESIIDALITNPNLGFEDFFKKYISIYEKKVLDDIRRTVTPYVRTSKESLIKLTENHYRFFHSEVMKPKRKVMTTN